MQKNCTSNPYPLMLLEINLKNYSDSDISTNALTQLDKMLIVCTQAKKQVILRFLYDWDGKALSAEPSSLPQIKNIFHSFPLLSTNILTVYISCREHLQEIMVK